VAHSTRPPKVTRYLADFLISLREQVFETQSAAGQYFGLHHTTISRYEGGERVPPLGYLACLVWLIVARVEQEGHAVEEWRQVLLEEVNKAIARWYQDEVPFGSWDELCHVTEGFMAKRHTARGGRSLFPVPASRPTWARCAMTTPTSSSSAFTKSNECR